MRTATLIVLKFLKNVILCCKIEVNVQYGKDGRMHMNDNEIFEQAKEMGICAAFVDTKDVVQDPSFRKFCEDNLCGKYNANYSCPPDCGTVGLGCARCRHIDKSGIRTDIGHIERQGGASKRGTVSQPFGNKDNRRHDIRQSR